MRRRAAPLRTPRVCKERVEVRTRDGCQRAGGADLEGELVGEIGIETGRQQIVTGRNPYPVAGDMQEREVLGMAVDVPGHQVEQRRPDEAIALVDGTCRRIQDFAYARDIEATVGGAAPLVLEQGRQTESLGKVLLMQADDASLPVQRTVEPPHQQNLDLTDLDDGSF